ncbi:hypothetical protein RVW00_002205 [Enterobacter bugandensis]|nr:hypothetical protein [Enterobacter bugandensis]
MPENILNLPKHLRRLRRVSSEQAALAMTGEYTLNFLFELSQPYDPAGYRAAHAFHSCIIDAVDHGLLTCITRWQGHSGETTGAIFDPDVIWPWALAELSDESPWYGATATCLPASPLPPPADMQRDNVRKNENHQLLIAGLARLLCSLSHGAYRYGERLNTSALARDVASEVAYALPPDADKTETFRKVLSDALRLLPSDTLTQKS